MGMVGSLPLLEYRMLCGFYTYWLFGLYAGRAAIPLPSNGFWLKRDIPGAQAYWFINTLFP